MNDKLFWLPELRVLIEELELLWNSEHPNNINSHVKRKESEVNTFVYGFPIFSGKRNETRVTVTLDYLHHAITSKISKNENVEILCQGVKKNLDGFISFRHYDWYEHVIKKMSGEWEAKTGVTEIDEMFYIQARSIEDKKMLTSPSFISTIKNIMPFSSLALKDTGVFWNTPVSQKTQFNISLVDEIWEQLFDLSKMMNSKL